MQLVSKISNPCDPDPRTSQWTDGPHAISICLAVKSTYVLLRTFITCTPSWRCLVCVAVKFIDDDTYEVSATRCRLDLTVVELRKRVADTLKIPCKFVQILQDGIDATIYLSIRLLITRY